jgi:hypothetical protein
LSASVAAGTHAVTVQSWLDSADPQRLALVLCLDVVIAVTAASVLEVRIFTLCR